MQVLVRFEYPPATFTLSLPADATVGALKTQVKGQSQASERYGSVSACGLGRDVVQLDECEDDEVLSELGVQSGDTIVFFALPADKPDRAAKKVHGKEVEEEDDTLNSDGEFKGISHHNVFTKLASALKRKNKKQTQLLMKYINLNTEELLKEKDFSGISAKLLHRILSSSQLASSEDAVLKACVSWARAKETKTVSVRDLLLPFLSVLRLPCLSMTAWATTGSSLGLLDQTQQLALFTYIASRGEMEELLREEKVQMPPLPASLKMLNNTPRIPLAGTWQFEISDAGARCAFKGKRTVYHTEGSKSVWASARTTKWLSSGTHKIKFKIEANNDSNWLFLGIAENNNFKGSSYVGSPGKGYTSASNGKLYPGGKYGPSKTPSYAKGDVVTMIVDCSARTVSFEVNGTSYGVAFSGINLPVCPAVTLYNPGDSITLL